MSIFRKVALTLWGPGGDPSVYGFLDVDVTHLKLNSSPIFVVIKGLSEVMKKNKDLNFMIRLGRLLLSQEHKYFSYGEHFRRR